MNDIPFKVWEWQEEVKKLSLEQIGFGNSGKVQQLVINVVFISYDDRGCWSNFILLCADP